MTDGTNPLSNLMGGLVQQLAGSSNASSPANVSASSDLAFLEVLTNASNTGASPQTATAERALNLLTAQWIAMYTLDSLPVPGEDMGTNASFSSNSANSMLPMMLQELSSMNGASSPASILPMADSALPTDTAGAIQRASQTYGVPTSLIHAVITQESGGNSQAVSSAGAQGLMQLMPGTAAALGVTNPFDPVQNIFGGTKYLAELLNRFHGNTSLAVAAYNAGPGAVESHGGIPPYPETQHYVNNVLSLQNRYASTASGQAEA